MKLYVLLSLLVALATAKAAGISNAFCKTHALPDRDPKGNKTLYPLPTSFMIDLERTVKDTDLVELIHVDYSEDEEKLHLRVDRIKDMYTEVWVDVKRDLDMMVMRIPDATCSLRQLNTSDFGKFFGLYHRDNGKVEIAKPEAVLRFNMGTKMTYVGTGTTRGGVPADKWQTCEFAPDTNLTTLVTFYIPAPTIVTPYGVSPLVADVLATNGTGVDSQFNFRYDYVNMYPLRQKDSNKLMPDPTSYCSGTEQGKPIPQMPSSFTFKGETINKGDPNLIDILPGSITYRKEIHLQEQQLYVMEELGRRTHTFRDGYGSYVRTIYDFKQGLRYKIDVITEKCDVRPTAGATDYHLAKKGDTPQNTSAQFFHLDQKYQYIGQRMYDSRRIECDVWVALDVSDPNNPIMYIWYFATEKWLKEHISPSPGPHEVTVALPDQPMPVALRVIAPDNATELNFYEFSADPLDLQLPDYSMCFDQSDSKILNVRLLGGPYFQMYLGVAFTFKQQFIMKLMEQGQFESATRVVNFDVQPDTKSTIWVSFKLLGNVIITRDAKYSFTKQYVSTAEIISNLKASIQTRNFDFEVSEPGNKGIRGILKAIEIHVEVENWETTSSSTSATTAAGTRRSSSPRNPRSGSPTATLPRASSPTATLPRASSPTATLPRASSHTTTLPTGPSKPTGHSKTSATSSTPRDTKEASKSSGGLSSGSAAGLAIGVLILGLLVGMVGVIVYQRFLGPRIQNYRIQTSGDFVELSDATTSQ